MKVAQGFAPAHVTGIFKICDESDEPAYQGSIGAGISIKRGVRTKTTIDESSKKRLEIWINGQKTASANVSEMVIKDFLSQVSIEAGLKVEHYAEVPLGGGFGSSGAGALSLALALNEVLELGLTRIQAAQKAHTAEILCKTGLGTVIAETFGGLEIRTKPGAPGIGEVKHIPLGSDYVFASLSLGSLPTGKALSNRNLRALINKWGHEFMCRIMARPTLENVLSFSRKFAENTGLITKQVRRVLQQTDAAKITCAMPLFGEGVFSVVKQCEIEKLVKIFGKHATPEDIIVCEIDFEGAKLIGN
ncbi:MAG: GHMP kinase [Candidatus Bathyarchaeota archaeon]|nr:GHMP kinase [Candidatus Bathyarchaeota archaeon]